MLSSPGEQGPCLFFETLGRIQDPVPTWGSPATPGTVAQSPPTCWAWHTVKDKMPLSPGHTPAGSGLWHPSMLLARGENWFLNVIFVFLLAKLIASWLVESRFKGEKGPCEA